VAYSGYQQYGYFRGLIHYGGWWGAHNQIKNAVGGIGNRITYGWSSERIVHLYKVSGVGTGGGIILRIAGSNANLGSDPGTATYGAWHDVWTGGAGSWGAYDIGAANADQLIRNGGQGICFIYDSTASDRYGEFNGVSAGADDCDLIVTWNWSYTSVSYIAPYWY